MQVHSLMKHLVVMFKGEGDNVYLQTSKKDPTTVVSFKNQEEVDAKFGYRDHHYSQTASAGAMIHSLTFNPKTIYLSIEDMKALVDIPFQSEILMCEGGNIYGIPVNDKGKKLYKRLTTPVALVYKR
jgi:hypothetical protein